MDRRSITDDPSPGFRQGMSVRGLCTRSVEAGNDSSSAVGRCGRGWRSPPQFGQMPPKRCAHSSHHVHSNVQITAPGRSAGKSSSQFSHPGFIKSMATS
jgi:hypothetical protein